MELSKKYSKTLVVGKREELRLEWREVLVPVTARSGGSMELYRIEEQNGIK